MARKTPVDKGSLKGKGKKNPAATKKKKAVKMKPTPKKKKKAPSVKPTQAKAIKKPAPAITPGADIDLKLPHDNESTPEPCIVSNLDPKAKVVATQETALEATEKEEKTAPFKEKEKTPEESATAREEKAEQGTPAPAKKKPSPEKTATGRSTESKTGISGKSGKLIDEQEDKEQFLAFRLGSESFAFEIDRVREVLSYTKVTKVPNTPDFMVGVINLRGNVVPVVDLRLLFGLGKGEMTEDTCIIIVEVNLDDETIEVGARADAVREVYDLKKDEIEPAPTMGSHLNTEYMLGMGKKDNEFLLLLDIEKVFSLENLNQGP